MLIPSVPFLYAVGGLTSMRGRSSTFDSRADGFGRGEACVSVLLGEGESSTRLSSAVVRQDGKSASLTAPNGQAQQVLLHSARIQANEAHLDVLQAHGTGTALGDPIEAGAVATSLGNRAINDGASLGIHSIKANVGHAEPAA
eukprot:4854430-Prymnesium_polylepis.1